MAIWTLVTLSSLKMCLLLCARFYKCSVSYATLRNFCISRGGKTRYIFYILSLIKLLDFRYIFKIEIFALFSIYIIRILKSEIFLLWNFGIWNGSLLLLSAFAKWKFLIRYSCKRDLTNSAFVKCCDCQTRNLYI